MSFEIEAKDAAGRIGKWKTPRGEITTPNIAIVVNPNILTVKPEEIAEMGFDLIITNSYIIMKSPRRKEVLEKGLHEYLGWDGPIYTDSGAFQMYSQGIANIDPSETVQFQRDIGSDVVTPLDVFTLPTDDRETASDKLRQTERRYRDIERHDETMLAGPVQGGRFMDLRRDASELTASFDFDVYAIGGIVPLMESYQYKTLADTIVECKKTLPMNKPVHAFGAGHPMIFSLLAALGCDIFDSAMYAIAAREGRYLTASGTKHLENLNEFPCACPVCIENTPEELKEANRYECERALALHNLHVTAAELRTVRQAIKEQRLWELVAQRSRSHPRLFEAFIHSLTEHGDYFEELEPLTKRRALLLTGEETIRRPEVTRALRLASRVDSQETVVKAPFGDIPVGLMGLYPFGQSVTGDNPHVRCDPTIKAASILDYVYGEGTSSLFENLRGVDSKKTGRLRKVYDSDVLVASTRSRDGMIIPTFEGAEIIHRGTASPANRIVVEQDVAKFAREGKSVFAKFVKECGEIFAGQEVFVVDENDELLATGTSELSAREMRDMDKGVAVTVRHKSE